MLGKLKIIVGLIKSFTIGLIGGIAEALTILGIFAIACAIIDYHGTRKRRNTRK